MTLRRTALARKSELKRATPMPRAAKARADRQVAVVRRQRSSTGPTPAQRLVVAERAGYCCEVCRVSLHDGTAWTASYSIHHRQARGIGGSSRPERNAAYNLLLLCGHATSPDGCHAFIEAHPAIAEEEGWIVRHGLDPATVPVTLGVLKIHGQVQRVGMATVRALLTADGDYAPTTHNEGA